MYYNPDEIFLYMNTKMTGKECFAFHLIKHMHLNSTDCYYMLKKDMRII
jgi:hypothetical protein